MQSVSLTMHTHLFDLSQLLPAPTDVVISDLVERLLFILSLDGHNAVRARVSLKYLQGEGISNTRGTVYHTSSNTIGANRPGVIGVSDSPK